MIEINRITWRFPASAFAALVIYLLTYSMLLTFAAFVTSRILLGIFGKGCLILVVFGICGVFGMNFIVGIDTAVFKAIIDSSLLFVAIVLAIWVISRARDIGYAMIAARNLHK